MAASKIIVTFQNWAKIEYKSKTSRKYRLNILIKQEANSNVKENFLKSVDCKHTIKKNAGWQLVTTTFNQH